MDVRTRRFSVAEYELIGSTGIFSEGNRIELIEGEIVEMAAKGTAHVVCVSRLNHWFGRRSDNLYWVLVQDPIVVSDVSEPEPDITLTRIKPDDYRSGLPRPSDIYLVIEVAESSLSFDRGRKADLYARAGIVEYWVVDAVNSRFEIFRLPSPQGYREVRTFYPGESVSPLAFPDLVLPVSEIVG